MEIDLQTKRWFRALEIAKVIFFYEGYHTRYLEEIEDHIKETKGVKVNANNRKS